jgi:hypothetical protein
MLRLLYLFSGLNLILWGWLTLVGVDLTEGVREQHVASYPTLGQRAYYVFLPLAFVTIAVIVPLLIKLLESWTGIRPLSAIGTLILGVMLLLVMPYLVIYGGGV